MKNCLMVLILLSCTITAQNITVSKDSLWVLNSYHQSNQSRSGDSLMVINNGTQPIHLDSARLFVTALDTAGCFFRITAASLVMDEWYHGTRRGNCHFIVNQIDSTIYSLDFSLSSRPFISVDPSGDSINIGNIQIVDCFFCDAPRFPNYIRGMVRFYFSNGEAVEIQLYSDDLRPPVSTRIVPIRHRSAFRAGNSIYLINGRKIPMELEKINLKRIRHRMYKPGRNE